MIEAQPILGRAPFDVKTVEAVTICFNINDETEVRFTVGGRTYAIPAYYMNGGDPLGRAAKELADTLRDLRGQ